MPTTRRLLMTTNLSWIRSGAAFIRPASSPRTVSERFICITQVAAMPARIWRRCSPAVHRGSTRRYKCATRCREICPKNFKTVLAKCLTHGRRNFVDALSSFPGECGHVIAELALVYHHDAIAARWNMTAAERLALHRDQSGPVMARLWTWMEEMLASGDAEENSGLGQAIKYMRRHWQGLTAFLEVEGAPIANDLVERALKWAIQYRKNSLQYRTTNGALVGDIMMSVIRTTIAAARNPVDYLTTLLRNAAAVAAAPELWLPWNYPVGAGA